MKRASRTSSRRAARLFAALCFAAILAGHSDAKASPPENCAADAVSQSVCIYKTILADVNKNYRMRGGGGISRIVQNSSTSYSAHISQEGREDVRNYEIEIAPKGKVTIKNVTENADAH